jgi:O-antigen ligase
MLGSVPIFFHAFPDVEARFVARTVADLSDVTKSHHFRVVRGGVEAGLHSPILGIGTANYRELCEDLNGNNESVDCNNHPHNFYVQVFAEVGILGLVAMIAMVGSIFAATLQARYSTNPRIFDRIAFVIPLAIFMPLQFTSDFFGQWNNLFMWTPLGLALASGTSVLMERNSQKKSN